MENIKMNINKKEAIKIKEICVRAIHEIHEISKYHIDWTDEFASEIRKGVGISIGTIDFRILKHIYEKFPELNDLKDY
jgi:hypothetical protein